MYRLLAKFLGLDNFLINHKQLSNNAFENDRDSVPFGWCRTFCSIADWYGPKWTRKEKRNDSMRSRNFNLYFLFSAMHEGFLITIIWFYKRIHTFLYITNDFVSFQSLQFSATSAMIFLARESFWCRLYAYASCTWEEREKVAGAQAQRCIREERERESARGPCYIKLACFPADDVKWVRGREW